MQFTVQYQDTFSKARSGIITTKHGTVHTPVFMPVGTAATVKAMHQRELNDIGAQIILANTYHLYLRPGVRVLERASGLHRFMGWDKPILTDSGGYQVYSLARKKDIHEQGVTFQSYVDGTRYTFTPEHVINVQRSIGSDIMMSFDECTPLPCSYTYAKSAMERTHRWLQRSCAHFDATVNEHNSYQVLFPIVQGSVYKELRTQSAEIIAAANRPGNAIGGVCHPTGQLYEVTEWVCDILPAEKPRYLMGVGTPEDVLNCIALGVDMFDCVMPTRNGRNGMLFTTQGIMNIKNTKFRYDFTPIDERLGGYVSTHYSKAYLHHLIRTQERLGAQIATIHNLTLYLWLIKQAQKHIQHNSFSSWKDKIIDVLMHRI